MYIHRQKHFLRDSLFRFFGIEIFNFPKMDFLNFWREVEKKKEANTDIPFLYDYKNTLHTRHHTNKHRHTQTSPLQQKNTLFAFVNSERTTIIWLKILFFWPWGVIFDTNKKQPTHHDHLIKLHTYFIFIFTNYYKLPGIRFSDVHEVRTLILLPHDRIITQKQGSFHMRAINIVLQSTKKQNDENWFYSIRR